LTRDLRREGGKKRREEAGCEDDEIHGGLSASGATRLV
jgi:hypothetical protein